jgi:hypothetical protein
MQIKIFAVPNNTEELNGDRLDHLRQTAPRRAQLAGWQYIPGCANASDLRSQIARILNRRPRSCLRALEIRGHGNPTCNDGITTRTVTEYAHYFRSLRNRMCDQVDIWLSGCNTGLTRDGTRLSTSIAEDLCNELPYDPSRFDVHIIVHGTLGYSYQARSAMEGNVEVTRFLRGAQV